MITNFDTLFAYLFITPILIFFIMALIGGILNLFHRIK